MQLFDEKDIIMRQIKELARFLFTLAFGKKYVAVELPEENKYTVSGMKIDEYKAMIDEGRINEAENILLEYIDYSDKEEVAAAAFIYQYISEKGIDFLKQNNYSEEEVYEGLKLLAERAGVKEVSKILGELDEES